MRIGEVVEPVVVKEFGSRISVPGFWSKGVLARFLSELKKIDCQETADGLFFKMAQITNLSWEEQLQRLRIYIAYARAGNEQVLVCLTHQLLEQLMKSNVSMFWRQECLDLKTKAIEELLDLLRDNFSIGYYSRDRFLKISFEPNRRIVGEFLARLFHECGFSESKIIDVLVWGGYSIIDMMNFYDLDRLEKSLRQLIETEDNKTFLAEIDAAFDKRMELETYHGLVHRKTMEAKIATYLFLWNLERIKREREKSEEETRRRIKSRAGDERV